MKTHFNGQILSPGGRSIGKWSGVFCESSGALFAADHFSNEDVSWFARLNYPVAYLKDFRIEKAHRGKGHGGTAMDDFKTKMKASGMICAFTRIADPETSKQHLRDFYRRNGWRVLPEKGTPRFAFCDLAQAIG